MPDSALMKILMVAVFGGVGAVARYGLSAGIYRYTGTQFPWGTAVVNILGCFLFGLVVSFADGRNLMPHTLRLYVLTGFMGAFTTFSTFGFESVVLLDRGNWLWCGANIAGQVGLGIMAIMFGLWLGKP